MNEDKIKQYINKITENSKIDSVENIKKGEFLESIKKSTQTPILYFDEKELINIPNGFSKGSVEDIHAIPRFERRSLLEYLPSQRHPIPYCVVRCKSEAKYFLIFREGGSGEIRLIGQKGLLGGHIDEVDKVLIDNNIDIAKTIENGLYRELEEEANLTKNKIKSIDLFGFIKIEELGAVENDHLGLVYIIDVEDTNLSAVEEGILSGDWFTKEEILNNLNSLENWSKIIFRELFK